MSMTLRIDFHCKVCKKFKTTACAEPQNAKARYGCNEHSAYTTYKAVFLELKKVIDAAEDPYRFSILKDAQEQMEADQSSTLPSWAIREGAQ